MRRVWIAVLLCAGCGSAQPALQPETPAHVWARPVASSQPKVARSEPKAPNRSRSAAGAPASSASSTEPVAPLSPERLAVTMISALDRQASLDEQERKRKQEEDDARMRRTMEQLDSLGSGSMGLGGLGSRGGTTMGGGSGIGLGGIGTIGRGGGGLASGSGRGYGGSVRPATPPKPKAKAPPNK